MKRSPNVTRLDRHPDETEIAGKKWVQFAITDDTYRELMAQFPEPGTISFNALIREALRSRRLKARNTVTSVE